jgi:hypothetical protein
MQMLAPTAFPIADRAATQRMLNDLALELTRSDAQLTDAVYRGNRVGAGWDTWFKEQAARLMDARDAYAQLLPADTDMSARLRGGALDLAASGGQLLAAHRAGNTFGSGWDTTLDRKISDVREAAERLYNVPNPGNGGSATADASRAAQLVRRSIDTIRTLPLDDRGSESTKATRLEAYNMNMAAQRLIEPHFNGSNQWMGSQLRSVDTLLTDANWQLARKPSPDGRFNGVDVRGALRDSQSALDVLERLTFNEGMPAPEA